MRKMWRGMGCKAHVDNSTHGVLANACGLIVGALLAAIAQCKTISHFTDRTNIFYPNAYLSGLARLWCGLSAGRDAPRSGAKLVLGTLNGYSRL